MTQIQTIHYAQGLGVAQRISLPSGGTVEQMARDLHSGIENLTAWVRAPKGHLTEWIEIPRAMWRLVRPKVDDAVMFGYRLGNFDFQSIVTVAITAIVSVVTPVLTAVFGPLGALAGAALGIGANYLLNALFPAQSIQGTSSVASRAGLAEPVEAVRAISNVDSDSNVLAKNGYLPIIAGTRRISPPEIASPRLYLGNGVQNVDRIFGFAGHHSITDVQVDGAPISDFDSITTEIKDGAEATGTETFVNKVSNFSSIGETLNNFTLSDTDLVDQVVPSNSEPRTIRFTTPSDAKLEEITIRLQIDSFIKSDSATQAIRVPLRIRLREKGSSGVWNNLPEIHMVGRDTQSSFKEIRLRWDNQFGASQTTGDIQYEFFQQVPAAAYTLSNGTSGVQWQAHSDFVADTGIMDTQNIAGKRNGIQVTLSEDTFPKQSYEWEIERGLAVNSTALAGSTYVLAGAVNSLFVARYTGSKWQVPVDQGAYVAKITASHVSALVNRQPCQRPKTALLALQSVGQSVRNVTVLAKSYVYDWDGSGWGTLTTSDNPAVQYRQILSDYLTHQGIDTGLIDNDSFVAWRQECINQGYKVSAVSSGNPIAAVLATYATAGFARPGFSDKFTVDWFRDRSSDRPKQAFSPRNSSISLKWVEPEKPAGIRAKFQNEDDGYRDDELQINNPLYTNGAGYQVTDYSSITDPDLIKRRATFDILQMHFQGRRAWVIDAAIEASVCERGDLVGIVTDLVDDTNSGFRVRKVIDSTTFVIDQDIPAESTTELFSIGNVFSPEDIFTVGETTMCLLSTPTGTEEATIVAAETTEDGFTIRVDTAFSSIDLVGAHGVLGAASRFMRRCIVSEVKRTSEERAQLICVDEAPEIYETMTEMFA